MKHLLNNLKPNRILIVCSSSLYQIQFYIEELYRMYPGVKITAFCPSNKISQISKIPGVSSTFCLQMINKPRLIARFLYMKKIFKNKADLLVIMLDGLSKNPVRILKILALISNSKVKLLAENYKFRKLSLLSLVLTDIWYILRIIGRAIDSFLALILLFIFLTIVLCTKLKRE